MQNQKVVNLIASLVLCIIFVFSPFLAFFLSFAYGFSYTNKSSVNYVFFGISGIFTLYASLLDLNFLYNGDVSRYWYLYTEGAFLEALSDLKLYRFIMFQVMDTLGLREGWYSFFSIFVAFLNFSIYFFNSIDYEKYDYKLKLWFIFSFLTIIPFWIVASYEMSVAFSFLCLGLYFNSCNKKYLFFFSFVFSVFVHSASLLIILFYLLSRPRFKQKIFTTLVLIFSIICFVAFIHFFKSGISVVDYLVSRFVNYLFGVWSNYKGLGEWLLIPYCLVKIYLLISLSKERKVISDRLDRFFLLYGVFALCLVFNRTLSFRYVYLSSFFFAPYLINYAWNGLNRLKLNKYCGLIVLLFLSLPEFRFVYYFIPQVNIPIFEVMTMSWSEFGSFNVNLPPHGILFEKIRG
ncbi:membrane hypothetical protein [Vibrio chagasii]|nr:membrane hypothetical protein [Vibrio chagasii]